MRVKIDLLYGKNYCSFFDYFFKYGLLLAWVPIYEFYF